MHIDSNRRSVNLDPRDAQFYSNPYPIYQRLHNECPVFKWEQYGHWCFSRFDDVNALLRDRRFGRQILHVATREELGLAEPPAHRLTELAEPGAADHSRMPFAHQSRSHGADERGERQERADRQERQREHETPDGQRAADDHLAAVVGVVLVEVAAKTRVALELLFDLAENSLFVFRERHGVLLSNGLCASSQNSRGHTTQARPFRQPDGC